MGIFEAISETIKGNFVEPEVKAERIEICKECPHLNNLTKMNCNKCGCFVGWKAALKTEACPIKKW